MIGTAIAPNATGAVLATSATTAALSGLKRRAMSMTVQIATGAPKPGERLEQGAEAERDDHGLDARIVRDRAERAPQDVEVPGVTTVIW